MYRPFVRTKRSNLYIFVTIVITLCLQSACGSNGAAEIPVQGPAKDLGPTLADAARLFEQRSDVQQLKEAVSLLGNVRNSNDRNFDVEWQFSKYSYFLGKELKSDDEASAVLEKGRDAGRIASRMQPSRPEGFFWFGANLGEMSRRSPITVGLASVDDIREAMNTVIEIDPAYQGASAFDALGQIELETRLSGGKATKAVEYLKKGEAIEKDNANIQLHLAEAYLELDNLANARSHLEYLVSMKVNPEYAIEHKEAVTEARKLLGSRF